MPEIPEQLTTLTVADKKLKFFSIDGQVASNQKWSETDVHSYGGGGYGRYATAPKVVTTKTDKHEIFIERSNGKQTCLALTDVNIKVAAGHEVSLVEVTDGTSTYPAALVNRTTDVWNAIFNTDDIVKKFVRKPSGWITFLGLFVVYYLAAWFSVAMVSTFDQQFATPAMAQSNVEESPPPKGLKKALIKKSVANVAKPASIQNAQTSEAGKSIATLLSLGLAIVFLVVRIRSRMKFSAACSAFDARQKAICQALN